MILSGSAIADAVMSGDITLRPFSHSRISPNSYDLQLGERCIVYKNKILDAQRKNDVVEYNCGPKGWELMPDKVYLFNSEEIVGSKKYVPIIRGRSSMGRLGIFVHITADLIDIGSINQLTFQIHCVQPVVLAARSLVAQVTFWEITGEIRPYSGKYADHMSPCASLSYQGGE